MSTTLFLFIASSIIAYLLNIIVGDQGVIGHYFNDYTFLKLLIYFLAMSHITITCMSLSFHRSHTHKGVIFNKFLDMLMQTWLWLVTGMSKEDWVSIHQYHHVHSDTKNDPHSPVQKGFSRVFFLGVFDYITAKDWPGVLKIRKRIKTNSIERFFDKSPVLGLVLMSGICFYLFGPILGIIISVLNLLISPIFAVGGVNGIAHSFGYRNHDSKDNSRNVGFLFPLNFIICGELDHNNHHAYQTSCSFRHRWYEFDIGYVYIKVLSYFKLAEIKSVYGPENLRIKMKAQFIEFLEKDYGIKEKIESMAFDMNKNFDEVKADLVARWEGKKKEIEPALEHIYDELRVMLREAKKFQMA